VRVLPAMLDRIETELGGRRKAVIFTESVRTQRYLSELLSLNGFAGQIALMNGTNKDPESQAIYGDWFARHKGSDVISGSKSADMKAAIVEAFRDQKTILIATEIRLGGHQSAILFSHCEFRFALESPAVEQRIGRCHRYGQKIDVLVVNLLNLKNRAEERVFELLESKFKLFDGVFGATTRFWRDRERDGLCQACL